MSSHVFLVFALLLFIALRTSYCQYRQLETYNVEVDTVSISGFSSGAGFAAQYHVVLSSTVIGAGILAGGPYACALAAPIVDCLNNPAAVNMSAIYSITLANEAAGLIDPLSNLASDRVFIFNGMNDTIVHPDNAHSLEDFYLFVGMDPTSINKMNTLHCNHGVPTVDRGVPCATYETDVISLNLCDYDGAYETMNQIYQTLERPDYDNLPNITGDFYEFDQFEFIENATEIERSSFGEAGLVYVASGCMDKLQECRLHIMLHGCDQALEVIGPDFIYWSGFLEVAELNDFIILFPQLGVTTANPSACWDISGETGDDYCTRNAIQTQTVKSIADRVSGVSQSTQ